MIDPFVSIYHYPFIYDVSIPHPDGLPISSGNTKEGTTVRPRDSSLSVVGNFSQDDLF